MEGLIVIGIIVAVIYNMGKKSGHKKGLRKGSQGGYAAGRASQAKNVIMNEKGGCMLFFVLIICAGSVLVWQLV